TIADFTVANGVLSNLSSSDGGITWTATLTPTSGTTSSGNLITLDNTGVQDAAGNTGLSTTASNAYAIDTQRPTATITVADTALAARSEERRAGTACRPVPAPTPSELTGPTGVRRGRSPDEGGPASRAPLSPQAGTT